MRTIDKTLLILGGGLLILLAAWLLHAEWTHVPTSDPGDLPAPATSESGGTGALPVLPEDTPDAHSTPQQRPIPRPTSIDEGPEELRGALVGRVLAGDQPVDGASIIVAPGPRDYLGGTPATAVEPRHGRSDSNGFFLVEDLPGGSGYHVTVRHPDYVAAQIRGVLISPYETTDLGAIVLEVGTSLTGRVVDPNDEPVPNAQIVFQAAAKPPGPFSGRESDPGTDQQTSSDAQGLFRLEHLGTANYVVRVTAPGFAPWIHTGFRLERAGQELTIRLRPALELIGRVVDQRERPIEGAELIAESRQPADDGGRCEETTTSDAQGRFRFSRLSPGVYWVRAIAEGYLIGALHQVEPGARDVEIRLERTGIVRGRVVHPDGRAAPEFTLRLESKIGDPASFLASGDEQDEQYFESRDGSFAFTCRKSGTFRLVSHGPDHADSPSEVFEIEKSGEVTGLEITARPGGRLEGQVLDAAGEPIRGAIVRLRDKNANEKGMGELFESAFMTPDRSRSVEVRSDENGQYEFPFVAPSEYKMQVIHPAYTEQWLRNVTVSPGSTTHRDIGLIRGGRIVGIATDPQTGEVLPRAMVLVTNTANEEQIRVLSDAQGFFEVRNLAPGSYRLVRARAADPFGLLGSQNVLYVEVDAGTETDLGRL